VAAYSWRFPFLIYLMAVVVLPLVLQLPEPDRDRPHHFELQATGPAQLPPIGSIGGIYGLTALAMLIFYMVPVQLPFYLQSLNLGGSWESGMAIALCTLASAIVSLNYAWIKARLSFFQVLLCLFCCMASGYGVLANATSYGLVILGLLIAGCGLGLLLPNMNVWLNAITPPQQRGRILGGLTTSMFLGQFLSPFAVQPIAQQLGLQSAYMLVAGILFMIGLSIATFLVFTTSSRSPQGRLR
jgi:MFS family permease